ncbi:MAG: precorrin-6y C5,15-methyltransferase (decarboxylating) subunit CbiE [Chloroflexi bacterium]|nr:precorrin-6y C5,15-methyltransferase (decarboxylating) subunit CbiE [Chloroflexota bacterium]MDA1269890.1 precorrin-6y C5,15-methyltransferase (decarboxylating) subunit CbiE [Chloroflexota bacterium]PKB59488.1 MAG: precorrin-6y C5,15-methyltransferase (decarboxylating) subunit CbiE [SAR202 cluster bacterium Casp-Chloro-G2]
MTSQDGGTRVTIIGVGPGDNGFLTLKAKQAVEEADLVAGFATVLNVVRPFVKNAELCPMAYRDQEEVLDYAVGKVKQGKSLVVCAWGDLNVSAKELLDRVRRRVDHVDLIPGISSVQIALVRSGISLEHAVFVTLHVRDGAESALEELVHYIKEGRRNVVLLPRPYDLMPAGIAAGVIEAGISGDRQMTVFQRLTHDDEQSWSGSVSECAAITSDFSDLSIMVFHKPDSD